MSTDKESMRQLCKSPVVFFTEATVHSCSQVESCKTNNPIAVAKATPRTDPPFTICSDTVALDSNNKGYLLYVDQVAS